jgi:MOSC domain-containing protein YiiM
MSAARIISISTGLVQPLFYARQAADGIDRDSVASAIRKQVVSSVDPLEVERLHKQNLRTPSSHGPSGPQSLHRKVEVKLLGLIGDEHADLSVHGGLDKAIYLYPVEHYPFWQTVSEQAQQAKPLANGNVVEGPLAHGKMGENLTITGINEKNIWIGDQLHIGEVKLRVESPRIPCFKFNAHMGFKHATKMMVQSGFCGFYCSVVQPGFVAAGDEITIVRGDQVLSIDQRFAMTTRGRQQDLF